MNSFVVFIIALIVLFVFSFFMKEFTKLALVLLAIIVLFGAGFIWGPEDLNEKLNLHEWLSKESSQKVDTVSGELEKKREENEVIDTQHIADKATEETENMVTKTKDKVVELFDK
ncbi:hypothetical protein [Bacillus sp. NPDC094106]|uniref:hypothetical protein n=1 Tax=Bacillus sp. NPDC094106 TaxID=3363949 RepID=UPI0037FDF46B